MAFKIDFKPLETKSAADLQEIVAQVGLTGQFRPGRIFRSAS